MPNHKLLFDKLQQVTKNNVCCKILKSYYEQKGSFRGLSKVYFSTKRLAVKLEAMVHDLKDYLIHKKTDLIYHSSNQYLSNSISFMKACKQHKSNVFNHDTMSIVKNRNTQLAYLPHLDKSDQQAVRYINQRCKQPVIEQLERVQENQTLRLTRINEYFVEENRLMTEAVSILSQLNSKTDDLTGEHESIHSLNVRTKDSGNFQLLDQRLARKFKKILRE